MKIAIGSDHAGFELKERLKAYLQKKGYQVEDCGTSGKESVDYPRFAYAVARRVADGACPFGIVVDGAGIGSAMVANKVSGVRAALCYDVTTARNAREHNNANVLTLGAGLTGPALAEQIVDTFLTTQCTVERHLRRVKMIDDLDRGMPPADAAVCPVSSQTEEDKLVELSAQDVQRIAARIQEMMGFPQTSGLQAPPVCGSEYCDSCGLCAQKTPDTVRGMLEMGADRISYAPGGGSVPKDIARYIDHTLLKPEATEDDIKRLCAEAKEFRFATVCINPTYVPLAAGELKGSPVKVCTVVGFPLGAHMPEIKAMEARRAIRDGAKEIDMVINIGALKSGKDEWVYRDIRMVVEACEDGSALSKVIIEAALLTDEEKVRACELAKRARADYVKTSTGFGPGGATVHDVELMSRVVRGAGMGVKAAGGIRSFEEAQKMIAAGATRIGASAGVKIAREARPVTVSN